MTFAKDLAFELHVGGSVIVAMAFRDDSTAEMVAISDLSFEGCTVESEAKFTVGERLRLHLRGQGWFDVQVRSVSACQASVVFNTHCRV